ncbi:MAG: carbohydrate-binding family V/XII [Xanthobacter sp. 17-67-6]|nr:MAG: carbohydrate-binding family V/XII [Xanthobacter sp. 17-67-6]
MLKVRLKGTSAITALTIASMLAAPFAYGQQQPAQQQTQAPGAGLAWPRDFDVGDSRLELYQPQINSWDGNKIGGRAAVAIGPKDGAPTYGFADFTAITTVDKAEGLVHLDTIAITKVEVPTAPDKAASIREALTKRLPPNGITVALDRLQASYAVNQKIAALKTQPVENTPPRIVFTDTLTVLVLISGDPDLKPVDGAKGFQRVVNTRPLMLRDDKGVYHLQAAGTWYETSSLDSTWVVTPQPATALQDAAKIAAKQNAPDPLLAQDGKPITPPPAIYVSATPTELVQTNGQPQMLPVAGTGLLSMSNADHAVFMDPTNNAFYVLISGRWFRATDLRGPWAFVASDALPADFAKISPQDPKANVLVSVAGTPQAKEAAIAATIPQTATVKRSTAGSVTYQGAPQFVAITGTSLQYAVNTPLPVIQVSSNRFYMVSQGVWFVSASPTGPWRVADAVPDVIYTIPVSSPVHYVTYVRIYSVQPETVVVGYTPGYMGVMVAPGGTVVYGSGYYCTGYAGATWWYGCPATYGYGAGFALGATVGFGFGFAAGWAWGAAVNPYWGPYWGAGPWGGHWGYTNLNYTNMYGRWGGDAVVAHSWGVTANGTGWSSRAWAGTTARGTDFAGRSAAAFNPYTGNYGAARDNSRYNPYTGARGQSSASVTGNAYTGNKEATRESTGVNPTAGTAHASTTSVSRENGQVNVDSKGVATNQRTGNTVGWNNGNVYADHDGNVYQHSDTGWNKATTSGWQSVDHNAAPAGLDQERQARQWGNERVDTGADRFGGAGFGGGARFGGGGFRR